MEVYTFLGVIIALVVGIIIGKDASSRGMSGFGWGAFTFLFCIVAIPIYLIFRKPKQPTDVIPTKEAERQADKTQSSAVERPTDTPGSNEAQTSYDTERVMSDEVRAEKECPKCAETIKRKAIVCRFCGYEYSEEEIKKDEEEIKKEEEKIKKEKEEIDAAEQARLESLKTTYKNIIITETDEGEYEVLGKTFKSLKTASDYIDFAEDQGMISDKSGKQADD